MSRPATSYNRVIYDGFVPCKNGSTGMLLSRRQNTVSGVRIHKQMFTWYVLHLSLAVGLLARTRIGGRGVGHRGLSGKG